MPTKRRKYPEVLHAESLDGDVYEFNSPEQIFLQELKGNESTIVASIKKGLTGKHEPSRITNCAKVLEALDDPKTPDSIRPKLQLLRPLVMSTLLTISEKGKVMSARAQANAIYLRAMRGIGRLDWPPDTRDEAWKERFNKVIDMCAERA
jgi:hypothetical protein